MKKLTVAQNLSRTTVITKLNLLNKNKNKEQRGKPLKFTIKNNSLLSLTQFIFFK